MALIIEVDNERFSPTLVTEHVGYARSIEKFQLLVEECRRTRHAANILIRDERERLLATISLRLSNQTIAAVGAAIFNALGVDG